TRFYFQRSFLTHRNYLILSSVEIKTRFALLLDTPLEIKTPNALLTRTSNYYSKRENIKAQYLKGSRGGEPRPLEILRKGNS
ncbi:hypothetical protein MJM66_23520, partial [Salmonella enterica subsp. enterica serovar Kentucky]|nr:hypothetical protein [Salmonella enterica subsp. enterica serovar Kentucky]